MDASGEPRACPLCEAQEPKPWLAKGVLRLVLCRRCGMVFADRVEEALATGRYYKESAPDYHLSPDKLDSDYAPVRFERELRLFRRFCPGGRVLDVGCSTGAFLYQLQSRWLGAYSVLGTDVAEAALNHAQGRGVPVLRRPFLEHGFGEDRFDAVTFWAVLEHVVQPKRFLHKAAVLLKPGGTCFILVPNLRSLAVRLLGARYRYLMPEHVNYFTRTTLRAFVATEPGLETILMRSTHFNPVVIWQDFWRRSSAQESAIASAHGNGAPASGPAARTTDEPRRVGDRRSAASNFSKDVSEAERAKLLKRTTAWKQNPWLKPLKVCYGGFERLLGAAWLADNLVVVLRKRS